MGLRASCKHCVLLGRPEGNTATGHTATAPLPTPGATWWCGGLWLDGGRDVVVRDNHFSGNLAGIKLTDIHAREGHGFVLEGNTLTENQHGLEIYGFGRCPLEAEVLVVSDDNTIAGNSAHDRFWAGPAAGDPGGQHGAVRAAVAGLRDRGHDRPHRP